MSQPVIDKAAVGRPSAMPFENRTSYQNAEPLRYPADFQRPMRHHMKKEKAVSTTAISSLDVSVLYFRTAPRRLRIRATASIPDEIIEMSMLYPHGKTPLNIRTQE